MKHRAPFQFATVFATVFFFFSALSVTYAASAAPLGFQLLCLENPGSCQGGGSPIISLDESMLDAIVSTNTRINRSIQPRSDTGGDNWTLGATSGDCEDYVLAKRQALIDQGLPASALRIAHVKGPGGEDHAVLVVKTDAGDLALDNLRPEIRWLNQTGYALVAMSGANPMEWR